MITDVVFVAFTLVANDVFMITDTIEAINYLSSLKTGFAIPSRQGDM